MSLPDVDFANIRPYGQPASRADAFEELSSVLIEQGAVEWPEGVRFERFGNPDGGRDGQGVLPDCDVWAWQAKYLFKFDDSAVKQITHSVRRALEAEPRLKRYYVVLPIDLPSGDTTPGARGGRISKSAHTRWIEAVQEWKTSAHDVEFILVNRHMLLTALTESRHAGRVRYWFDVDVLSSQWQRDHMAEASAKAGPRYTPDVHVEVAAARALDAAGRTDAYVREWQHLLAQLREFRPRQWSMASRGTTIDDALDRCRPVIDAADEMLERMIATLRSTGEPPEVQKPLRLALESLSRVNGLFSSRSLSRTEERLLRHSRSASSAIEDGLRLAASEPSRAAAKQLLLLTGRAGCGKTHLLCDTAQRRTENGAPTILLFGQDFDGRALLEQVGKLSRLGETDDALAVLNAASEAAGRMGLLIIDALNESAEPNRWPDAIRQLATMRGRYPHIALVLSCRTEFVEEVVGDQGLPEAKHTGFAEATDRAVLRFTQVYGLEPSTFASLNPEFGNPLYLKLACEALHTLGEGTFRLGVAGLTTVTSAFLNAVNLRLSEPGRCDFDHHRDYVGDCVRELAKSGADPWPREDVQRITEDRLPGRGWRNSLLRHLIAEGVLMELPERRLRFGYQRLGDIARAWIIADQGLDGVQAWLNELGDDDVWIQRGVLDALAIILPERHGREITDLVEYDPYSHLSDALVSSCVDSLLLRDPESVTPRAADLARSALALDDPARTYWPALFPIACIPGHPLNAQFLHNHLCGLEVPDRDLTWSAWLVNPPVGDDDAETQVIRRLIDWAWTADPTTRTQVPEDIAELAVLTLGWLLTTADQMVRDDATKALVSLGERAPAAFTRAIIRFRGVNDPYITERLTAAACGIVLRNCTDDTAALIADAVHDLLVDECPLHLLTRDYVRRVFAEAGARGWQEPQRTPAGSQRPIGSRTAEEIRRLAERAGFNLALISDRPEEGYSRRSETRIKLGKKYRQIGFYEALGRITDNHDVCPKEGAPSAPYKYPEQVISRDFDPTVLVRVQESPSPDQVWFSPGEVDFAEGNADDPGTLAGIPDPLDLIAVRDPHGTPQLVLASRRRWHQLVPPKDADGRAPRRWAWVHITAYLASPTRTVELKNWTRERDWLGRPLPQEPDVPTGLLGAYPADPHWAHAHRNIDTRDMDHGGQPPAGFSRATAWYAEPGSTKPSDYTAWDDAVDGETSGWIASPDLHELLGLGRGVDFVWDDGGGIAVHSPSAGLYSPPTLVMRRNLMPRITDAKRTLFWTVLIGKQSYDSYPHGDYQWVNACASYLFDGEQVTLVKAEAARLTADNEVEHNLEWTPRQTDH
ncbi:MAG TPA: hypothetical protein VFX16_22415 [Pseudonocardiaceae bacterium]|nr:hypothetical protein [Pseudonocardiaceae bacterium]